MSKKKALQHIDATITAHKTAIRSFLKANAVAANDDQRTGSRLGIGICETTIAALELIRAELLKGDDE